VKTSLCVEALEHRDCPATANLFNSVLTVQGTDAGETIVVTRSGALIGAAGQWFNAGLVTRVVIAGKGGNDLIQDGSDLSAVIYGGEGNDTISGGRGHDKIYGSRGTDFINGDRGSDMIFGGGGADSINGGLGTNTIFQGSPSATKGNSAIENEIIQLVNAQRAANGLPPLAANGQLNIAAALHSQDMAAIGNVYGPNVGMQHTLYGTTRPEVPDRLAASGYDDWNSSYAWGENIAYGYPTAQSVMNGWMNSAGHRANILSTNYTQIGVSVVVGSDGIPYYTQVFGKRT
jgi:uncharacterized protein YkwD